MEYFTDILQLSKKFISIPSASGNIEKLVEILGLAKTQLRKHTPITFISNHYPSLLYTNQINETKKFKIILNAHLDVVPGEQKKYTPREENGRLYGRGAYDMKAAAAVMIILFKEIASKISYPLALQITTDEEIGGFNGTLYQLKQGIRSDFAIMGECNSNFRIVNQAKGREEIKITSKGNSAHSAHAWLGENAIYKMLEILKPILQAFPTPEEETHHTTVNITKVETGNNATNVIPDSCTAYLDIRFSHQDKDTIVSKIRSLLPKDISIEYANQNDVHYTNPNNIFIKMLADITTEVTNKKFSLKSAHGTGDTRFFTTAGCDAVEFGPIGENPHHTNEWVDIKSLEQYYQILKQFLLSIK